MHVNRKQNTNYPKLLSFYGSIITQQENRIVIIITEKYFIPKTCFQENKLIFVLKNWVKRGRNYRTMLSYVDDFKKMTYIRKHKPTYSVLNSNSSQRTYTWSCV